MPMRRRAAWAAGAILLTLGACRPVPPRDDAGARLAAPYPIESFRAIDLDGHDRSLATLRGKVVIVNVWATWCGPCRREIPALAALQSKYAGKLQIVGLLQDNVSDDAARAFGASVGMNFPIVSSNFEIESRLPKILALPTTFVLDDEGRLVAMYAEQIDPAQLEREVVRLMKPASTPGR